MELEELMQIFDTHEVPKELIWLNAFQNNLPDYSQGFYLLVDDKSGLKTWCDQTEFLERLIPFAQANGTGSFYAMWDDGLNKEPGDMPIVVFGDEGGMHVVAENILQLMQVLTFDSEISVDHEQAYFYKEEADYEESEHCEAYKSWLKEYFKVNSIEDPNSTILHAQKKYKELFDSWVSNYYKDE